jgi:hypothetical protein
VPVELQKASSSATINTTNLQVQSSGYAVPELAPHVISIGDSGILKTNGQWAKTASQVQDIFTTEFPAATSTWSKKRLVLYAHGGLVSEDTAVNRIGWYWSNLKSREMYLVGFVWHTDYLVGHSAGSIFLAPLMQFIGSLGLQIQTCTLWAPACTVDIFTQYYVPAIGSTIKKFTLFTLDDTTERADNCAEIYHKSCSIWFRTHSKHIFAFH